MSATCASTTQTVRLLNPVPSCSVVAGCPASSSGCVFGATMTAQSNTTIGTAQARLRIVNIDFPSSYVDYTCTAPAAILASGAAAGCSLNTPSSFLPAGTRYSATCSWVGSTISINAKLTCGAYFSPLNG
jgi:hypothetical protein